MPGLVSSEAGEGQSAPLQPIDEGDTFSPGRLSNSTSFSEAARSVESRFHKGVLLEWHEVFGLS
jgi:hypothetical protein